MTKKISLLNLANSKQAIYTEKARKNPTQKIFKLKTEIIEIIKDFIMENYNDEEY